MIKHITYTDFIKIRHAVLCAAASAFGIEADDYPEIHVLVPVTDGNGNNDEICVPLEALLSNAVKHLVESNQGKVIIEKTSKK